MRIGITLGDVTGIGPEVTLKALAAEYPLDDTSYLIIGNAAWLCRLSQSLKPVLGTDPVRELQRAGRLDFAGPAGNELSSKLTPGAPEAARAAYEWVREGARYCLRGELQALVTAPVNKAAIVEAGISFTGQTELLSQLAGTEHTAMMLLGQDDRGRWLRVALVTTHVPIHQVASSLSTTGVLRVIELAAGACRDLGLSRRRVAVCGLNPHAGENGHIGTEEISVIGPAVEAARRRGIDVTGPISADALFYHAFRGDYDAVVAMYHDQGLAPLKMVAFEQGVNWTLGLPFIRTSPDHGTAYDIAGQGKAESSSMVAALRLAKQLAAGRARQIEPGSNTAES